MAYPFVSALHAKVYEPVKRRKGSTRPEWIRHRFPIKGGISWRAALARDCMSHNVLLKEHAGEPQVYFRGIPVGIAEE